MMNSYKITISEKHEHQRIDKVLSEELDNFSRSKTQNLLSKGIITVNGKKVKSNYKVKSNDEILIFEEEVVEVDIVPVNLNLDIVYEDSDVAVLNKPSGMVVHPAYGHTTDTLVNGLMYQIKDLSGINGEIRPGIVHRIDKDTSGLLMIAKNDVSHVSLVDQLKEKTVNRRYLCLVEGVIPHNVGKINAPIGRDLKDRKKMSVTDKGKDAITHFNVLERFKNHTLIECRLETGRTHQIRVHMKYIGYPVYGDPQYGRRKTDVTNGQLLHAKLIGFIHPKTKEYMEFSSELPSYFTNVLEQLRADN